MVGVESARYSAQMAAWEMLSLPVGSVEVSWVARSAVVIMRPFRATYSIEAGT